MEQLRLNVNDATEENIYKIIDYVIKLEKEHGLTDDEIIYKYTHSDCICLAFLIKTLLPNVIVKWFGSCSLDAHCCIAIKGDSNLDSKLDDFIDEDLYYFDINGKKYYDEMCLFLANVFHTEIGKINARYQGSMVGANINETTAEILKNVIIIYNEYQSEDLFDDKSKHL